MITKLVLFPLPRIAAHWSGIYLFLHDGLLGAMVVSAFAGAACLI